MSIYQIQGFGLPSKPRAAQPSMFEILSWTGEQNITESRFQQPGEPQIPQNNSNSAPGTQNLSLNTGQNRLKQTSKNQPQAKNVKPHVDQTYKQHQSPQKIINSRSLIQETIPQIAIDHNQPKIFQKSHLFKKPIKHQLNSYEPANLKASRAKSAATMPKNELPQKVAHTKEEVELDEKTIKERKKKIKEFEIFSRVLPNSAITTYYGKPAFEAYGRGTSCKNLKSFNVMPHKGQNHPKHIESHYTALIKARNIKSKSYMPRKPLEQQLPVQNILKEEEEIKIPQLPLQKPDLIKSNRFATNELAMGKKQIRPKTSYTDRNSSKRQTGVAKGSKIRQRNQKKSKLTVGDGLKYMNKRQNLIDLLDEKKTKASQLAYKITECYPLKCETLQLDGPQVQNSNLSKPAGKPSNKGEPVSELIQSQFILNQTTKNRA